MNIIECHNHLVYLHADWGILKKWFLQKKYSSYFVLVDENTKSLCLPVLKSKLDEFDFILIETPSGEENKTIATSESIWSALLKAGADRNAVMINLGGGVIGDMGGFAAACYMRGIDFVQMPTSLLAQVDASVGAKTGVDFQDVKNLVGLFKEPSLVWIDSYFLQTLPSLHLINGFAEIIKHALIKDASLWKKINEHIHLDLNLPWPDWIHQSVKIKKSVVDEDFEEKGLRKILNFGHTIGHAVESYFLHSEKQLLHGEAIAIGMICEAFLSKELTGLSDNELKEISAYMLSHFPHNANYVRDKTSLIHLMSSDKKNVNNQKMFSLLEGIGTCQFNIAVSDELILASLDYYAGLDI
jgi:3-dehydroquinate synthase